MALPALRPRLSLAPASAPATRSMPLAHPRRWPTSWPAKKKKKRCFKKHRFFFYFKFMQSFSISIKIIDKNVLLLGALVFYLCKKYFPDLRTLLQWNPSLLFDENGEVVIPFYSSDIN